LLCHGAGDEKVTGWSNANSRGWRARASNLVSQYPPALAIDGQLAMGSCTMVLSPLPGAAFNWWAVDFGREQTVGSVKITRRTDMSGARCYITLCCAA
jgi:hypothetical protein